MLLLITTSNSIVERYRTPHLGRLVQPRHYWKIEETEALGIPWAVDNDAFNGGFDARAWDQMLDRLGAIDDPAHCLFVATPDVVGDAAETARLFRRWAPGIARRGLPIGFVAQDGLELERVPWFDIAAVFIGGTDDYKLGPDAERLVSEAKSRGRWVHMGRVNSFRRLERARALGCDSVDGSSWARWHGRNTKRARDRNKLERALSFLGQLELMEVGS